MNSSPKRCSPIASGCMNNGRSSVVVWLHGVAWLRQALQSPCRQNEARLPVLVSEL
ncbi:hypothetical protein D9M71_759500 [compost metagenome]